jgi:hypothetical protein
MFLRNVCCLLNELHGAISQMIELHLQQMNVNRNERQESLQGTQVKFWARGFHELVAVPTQTIRVPSHFRAHFISSCCTTACH